MAQWYEHQSEDGNSLWLYSERGLMTFLFCHVLVEEPEFILNNAKDVDGILLRDVVGEVQCHTTLTECELGPQGFGSPDGGLLLKTPNNPPQSASSQPQPTTFLAIYRRSDSITHQNLNSRPKAPAQDQSDRVVSTHRHLVFEYDVASSNACIYSGLFLPPNPNRKKIGSF